MAEKQTDPFPVIGIGASAGGLAALKEFFSKVSKNSGMAYIVVTHMSPDQPSLLPELINRVSSISADFAKDGEKLKQDRIYIAPPDKEVNLFQNTIQLMDISKREVSLHIDYFLRSLAGDQEENAAGIILSGTGTDGTLGLKEIKQQEGLVLVQSVESAEYRGMPESAIATGIADKVLPPGEMPGFLSDYFANRKTHKKDSQRPRIEKEEKNWVQKIFSILRTKLGHDFSSYKENTIFRRIQRRMDINQIKDPDQYIRFLREHPKETEALFREFLIGVTHFFRDRESFESLKKVLLEETINRINEGEELRVWVPGCSTGEEAYSVAIVIRECMQETSKQFDFQIFGTDIDNFAIQKAREGIFPGSIAADITEDRLSRFFTKEGDYYQIRKEIRESVIFSVQNILKDPPFSRLDLLCCRNLLIYLKGEMQKKLLPLFHYTLRPGGLLMLGSSETVGQFSNLFQVVDNKWKIYRRVQVPLSLQRDIEFPTGIPSEPKSSDSPDTNKRKTIKDFALLTEKAILRLITPTSLLVDEKGTVLHVQGRTGKYLETISGPPSHNINDLAREGLKLELSSALRRARSTKEYQKREGISVKTNGTSQEIQLHIYPLKEPEEMKGKYLVVFEDEEEETPKQDSKKKETKKGKETTGEEDHHIAELEEELRETRERHQTTVEELESTNEELKSSNEELQSTNEELESSKEELQSLNEELQTVNSELEDKVSQLYRAKEDFQNLLNSTGEATIFIDNNLRIKRYTREVEAIINLIKTDLGRSLKDMEINLKYEGLIDDIQSVIDRLSPVEKEVQDKKGKWYLMRIRPYKTSENKIDGAVIVFFDIDAQKKTQEELQRINEEQERSRILIRKVFDMNNYPLLVLDREGNIVIANTALTDFISLPLDAIEGMSIFDLETPALNGSNILDQLHIALEKALNDGKSFSTSPFSISHRKDEEFIIRGEVIRQPEGDPYRILLAVKSN